jgi:hypothetical protein
MPATISLKKLVDEMDVIGDEVTVYLNRQSGEFAYVTDDDARAAEEMEEEGEGEEDDALEEGEEPAFIDRDRESLAKTREILETDDWLALPSKFDIHEYAIMRDFCDSIENEDLRADLLDAIHGSGAFRRFKNMIGRRGLLDQWYAWRREAFEEIARDWLTEREIPFGP